MPMRVGEMMVIIRAQDFASRTLRRVGGEFAHMSRQQMIAAKKADLAFRKSQASMGVRSAQEAMKPLRLIERRMELTKRLAMEEAAAASARTRLNRVTPADTRLIAPAQREMLRGAIRDLIAVDKQVDLTQHQLARLNSTINGLGGSWARANQSQYFFNREMSRAKANLATAYNGLDRATRAQLAFNHAISQMPMQKLHDAGRAMSGIGRTMQLFGAGATIAFGAAANSAAQFDTSISAAATQARDIGASASQVQQRIDQLTNGFEQNGVQVKGVLDLMREFPAAQEEMAASAYEVFSGMDLENEAIVDVAKGMGLLKRANQIAVAGNVDLEEATSAMITTFNNFGSSAAQQAENLDTMFDIVRFGRMRLSDFNIMMNKIAPAAADAGMKLEDVGGAMAYLTRVMPSQRMVATGISRLIEALRHPDIVKGLKELGVDAKDATGRMRPLDKILQDIAERFPAMRTGQQSAAEFFRLVSQIGAGGGRGQIFTAEGRRALSEMLTHFDDYLEVQGQIERNHGEFGATLEAQMESLGVQWNIFLNQMRALVIVIGQEAIPVFIEIGQHIERFIKWFSDLDPEIRRQIVTWGVYLSVGTLLAGVLLSVVGSIASLIASLKLAGFQLDKNRGFAVGLATALRAIAAFSIIKVMIKVLMGGDPSAMDFLKAALAGGLLGMRFGPAGAVVGAITIPVILKMMSDMNRSPVEQAYKQYVDDAKKGQNLLKQAFDPDIFGLFDLSKVIPTLELAKPNVKSFEEFRKEWQRQKRAIADAKKIRDEHANSINKETTAERENRIAKQESIAAARRYMQAMEKYQASMQQYGQDMKTYREEMDRYNDSVDQWKESLVQATKDAKSQVLDNLRSMYDEFLAENEAAFGEFMQGPWLTSETFNLAEEWGITAGINDLIRDLNLQNEAFAKWRASLAKLSRRGLPQGLVDQFRKLGPEEGQSMVDSILKADPAKVNALIAQWKRKQAQIQAATKMDFKDEIDRFRKAGVDMGDAIINGFQSAEVGKWFDNWVQTTFPNVIAAAVNAAITQWKDANPIPTPPPMPKKPTPPQPPRTTGTGNGGNTDNSKNTTVHVQILNPDSQDRRDKAEKDRLLAFVLQNAVIGAVGKGG